MFNEARINSKIENFITQIKKAGAYADIGELRKVFTDFFKVLRENKDCTPGEIAHQFLKDVIDEINDFTRAGYADPGILVGFDLPKFNICIRSGYTKTVGGIPIIQDTLFDLASISKLYTGVITYKLIDEGILSTNQKIKDILKDKISDPKKLDGITVGDIMRFEVDIRTPGRIDAAKSVEEAKELLFNASVAKKGEYVYTDMGLMILKEALEEVTGKSFEQLFYEYIIKPLSLDNTMLWVPKEKRIFVTGTPNSDLSICNDLKVPFLDGNYGHAGVFASNFDLLKFVKNIWINPKFFNPKHLEDLVTPGINLARGGYGSTYVGHPDGLNSSFVDKIWPAGGTFAVQGSTRTQVISSLLDINGQPIPVGTSILQNPGSLSLDDAMQREKRINEERKKAGKNPISVISQRELIDANGDMLKLWSIDSRNLVPIGKLDKLNRKSSEATLKLALLGIILSEYEPRYDKREEVDIKLNR